MDRLIGDLRYSIRTLVRTPAFTAVAVLTLALGIGATTAVYAVLDGVLLRPFPYPDMKRLMILSEMGGNGQQMSVAWPNFQDWRAQNDVFEELGLYRGAAVALSGGGDAAERLNGSLMSSSVFASMGQRPLAGRAFNETDDAPGASRIAIISERLWRGRFGARGDIVGLAVTLNSQPFTIVGVMPAGMRFPSRLTDVWLPLGLFVDTFPKTRGAHPGLSAVGRLKAGRSGGPGERRFDDAVRGLASRPDGVHRDRGGACRGRDDRQLHSRAAGLGGGCVGGTKIGLKGKGQRAKGKGEVKGKREKVGTKVRTSQLPSLNLPLPLLVDLSFALCPLPFALL